jgi:hypothetical protein
LEKLAIGLARDEDVRQLEDITKEQHEGKDIIPQEWQKVCLLLRF